MFTKEDYEKYFEQVAYVERRMIYRALELDHQVNEESLNRVLRKIGEDEVRHYGFALDMQKIICGKSQSERRLNVRGLYLGLIDVRMLNDKENEVYRAYCVNFSEAGICFETPRSFPLEACCIIQIRFVDRDDTIERYGRIIWSKAVEPELFIVGMDFELKPD